MLCAKYDYKMDITVKKQEAFEDGQQAKAEESAIAWLRKGMSPEDVAECEDLPLEKVLELQKSINNKA